MLQYQHSVSDEYLKQIGDMTVSFAILEKMIVIAAGMLCQNCQEVVQIAAAQLSFRNLRVFLASIYIERFGQDANFPALRKLMKRAELLEDRRNQVTHSLWFSGHDHDTIWRSKHIASKNKGLKHHMEAYTLKDLASFVKEINILAYDIEIFFTSGRQRSRVPVK